MLAAVLALLGSACWGTADFLGGIAARRMAVLRVVAWGQAIGLVAILVGAAVAVGPGSAPPAALAGGAVAGVVGGVAISCFYYALARSPMSLVAPITAAGVVIPVTFSFVLGEVPSRVAMAGVLFAIAGILAVSLAPPHPGEQRALDRRGLAVVVVAAVGFATVLTILDHAAGTGDATRALWAAVGLRAGSLATVVVAALATRTALAPPAAGGGWALVLGVGIGDTTANVLYAIAAGRGNLAVVAALGSLYPVSTVILARVVLRERTTLVQRTGIVLALVGVVCASAA